MFKRKPKPKHSQSNDERDYQEWLKKAQDIVANAERGHDLLKVFDGREHLIGK